MTIPPASADARSLMLYDSQKKSTGIAYLLWFFLRGVGGHRFYLGRTGSGAGMLILTVLSIVLLVAGIGVLGLMAVGVWALVDAFLIPGMVDEHNKALIAQLT